MTSTKIKNIKKCNKCGLILKQEHDMKNSKAEKADALAKAQSSMITIEIPWGYFSGKDGEIHKIILCESCYDQWVKSFQIPVEIEEIVEIC